MKLALFACGLGLLAMLGCNLPRGVFRRVPGSGVITQETRTQPPFSQIQYGGSATLRIVPGPEHLVTVTCDDNLHQHIHTRVQDGVLQISTENNIQPSDQFEFCVTSPELKGVQLHGSGTTSITEHQTGPLNLSLTGSGSVVLESIRAEEIDLDVTGSGFVSGSGATKNLRIQLTGSGSVSLIELEATNVSANSMGAGEIKVFASDKLEANVTGSGSITCFGRPESKLTRITGSGTIQIPE